MDAAGLQHALVAAAENAGELVDSRGGFLHEQEVGTLMADEVHDIVERGADEAEQIPADDLDHAWALGLAQRGPERKGARPDIGGAPPFWSSDGGYLALVVFRLPAGDGVG